MKGVYFLHQIKHNKNSDTWDKGIVVKADGTEKENWESVLQSYHAYLGAYAYGHDSSTDYVACYVTNLDGIVLKMEIYGGTTAPDADIVPDPEPVPTPDPPEE